MRFLFGITSILLFGFAVNAQWVRQKVDTTASLRGLAVVNEKVVWASGTGGTVIRTIDGGKTWNVITVPGAEKLDFRDIEAFDANTAYILSIGNGDSSRIYKTTDGGKTWKLQFKNDDPKKFFDAIACWENQDCIAMGDPVDGKFVFIRNYGGEKWEAIDSDATAAKDQAAFAASGTCLITVGSHHPAMVVSGGSVAEVLVTDSNGRHWEKRETPFVSGPLGSGIFSIAMFDHTNGVIVGGNYEKPDEHNKNLAFTTDGGGTWALKEGLSGYRSGVTYVDRNTIIAVGTNGSDFSRDAGKSWLVLGIENLNAVQSKGAQATWAVGPKGIVLRLKGLQPASSPISGGGDYALHTYSVDSLSLSRDTVDGKGDATVQVTARSSSDDYGRYVYAVSAGKVSGTGPNVTWDLTGATPGRYMISAGISSLLFGRWDVLGTMRSKVVTVR